VYVAENLKTPVLDSQPRTQRAEPSNYDAELSNLPHSPNISKPLVQYTVFPLSHLFSNTCGHPSSTGTGYNSILHHYRAYLILPTFLGHTIFLSRPVPYLPDRIQFHQRILFHTASRKLHLLYEPGYVIRCIGNLTEIKSCVGISKIRIEFHQV
jgi:hypothetical protein